MRQIPGGPAGRRLLAVQLVDKLGNGLFLGVIAVHLAADLGLGATAVGLVLCAAGVGGVAGAPVAGRLLDQLPPRSVLRVLHGTRAGVFAAYPFVDHAPVLAGLSLVIGFCDRAAVTSWQVLVAAITGTERAPFQGWSRATGNAAAGAGGLIGAAALAGGVGWVRGAIVIDAVSFLGCLGLLGRVPSPAPGAAPRQAGAEPGPRPGSPWRDRSYRRFLLGESLLLTHNSMLKVGLPLWTVLQTRAPHATTGFLLAINTGLVMVGQIPVSRRIADRAAALAAVPVVAVAMTTMSLLLVAAHLFGPAPAVACLLAAAAALTAGEIVQSATSWELSLALAPPARRGAYVGSYQAVRGVEEGAGPLVVAAVCAAGPVAVVAAGAATSLGAALERLGIPVADAEDRARALAVAGGKGPGSASSGPPPAPISEANLNI